MNSWSWEKLHGALRNALGAESPPILGVGQRAFPRLGPGLFMNAGYRILSALNTGDVSEMGSLVFVACLQEGGLASADLPNDTLGLLAHPLPPHLRHLLAPGTSLLVYQETAGLRDLAAKKGWRLLANPYEMRLRWQDKAWFRRQLQKAALPALDAEIFPWGKLSLSLYETLHSRWGDGIVLQIPDFPRGGGRATFFLTAKEEVEDLLVKLASGHHRGHPISRMMASPLVEGPSLSMEGCVTACGTLMSPLQTQMTDLPQLLPPGRYGRFCGHQWGLPRYLPEVEATARAIVRWVGEALAKEGYRGIFGVDLALDRHSGRLYALECNPRYTGAFPALTLLQMAAGLLPMEAFHLLALLGEAAPYPVDMLNEAYRDIPQAAQLLLFHRGEGEAEVRGALEAGRYRWSTASSDAQRVGPAYPLPPPPWNPLEFVVVDGPPLEGSSLGPGDQLARILRVIFLRAVLSEEGALDMFAGDVIRWIYTRLGLHAAQPDST